MATVPRPSTSSPPQQAAEDFRAPRVANAKHPWHRLHTFCRNCCPYGAWPPARGGGWGGKGLSQQSFGRCRRSGNWARTRARTSLSCVLGPRQRKLSLNHLYYLPRFIADVGQCGNRLIRFQHRKFLFGATFSYDHSRGRATNLHCGQIFRDARGGSTLPGTG